MLTGVLLSLALVAQAPAPPPAPHSSIDDVYRAAVSDLIFHETFTRNPEKRQAIRYVSLHGIAPADRDEFLKALRFAINSAQFRTDLHEPRVVAGGALVAIDLEALGWDRYSREATLETLERAGVKLKFGEGVRERYLDIWDDIAESDPWTPDGEIRGSGTGRGQITGYAFRRWVAQVSGSRKLIVSAHFLYPRLLLEAQDGGYYSQLLVHPPTLDEFLVRIGVPKQFVADEASALHGAAVAKSYVAFHPRELQEMPAGVGYDVRTFWLTADFARVADDDKDVRASPAGTSKPDGREGIYTLPNGLHSYILFNGAGRQVNIVPQAIALDQRPTTVIDGVETPPIVDRSVITSYKCIGCHGETDGVIDFQDRVLRLILAPRTKYAITDPDYRAAVRLRDRLEQFYRGDLKRKVAAHRVSYAARVKACNGLTPPENSRLVVRWYDRLSQTALVDPEQVAREMGYPLDVAKALWLATGDSSLGYLAAGDPIVRQRLEKVIPKAFHVAAQPAPPTHEPGIAPR